MEILLKDARQLDHISTQQAKLTEDQKMKKDILEIWEMLPLEKTVLSLMKLKTISFHFMDQTQFSEDHS